MSGNKKNTRTRNNMNLSASVFIMTDFQNVT